MRCPQCETELPDDAWNCTTCAINVYWASRHLDDIARLRRQQGLSSAPDTAPFLLRSYAQAMSERAPNLDRADDRVRQLARRSMRRRSQQSGADGDDPSQDGTTLEARGKSDP